MPLTNLASYVPTMNSFISHWNSVNSALAEPFLVKVEGAGTMTVASFTALKATLVTRIQGVIDEMMEQDIARGRIKIRKAAMLKQFNEFTGLLDGYWADTEFINARPYAPTVTDGLETFLKPMREMLSLWGKLNAAPAPAGITLPLTLTDGTEVADFALNLDGVAAAYVEEADAEQDAVLARARRNETMATAKATMLMYRKALPPKATQDPVLVETMPAVTPPPGHTPKPVNASAVFVAPDQAKIVYEASTEATLSHYELRGNPGPAYDDEDAVVVATHAPGDPREFVTGFGLTQPGTEASFKVYVILTTGNESGSAAMTVERPV